MKFNLLESLFSSNSYVFIRSVQMVSLMFCFFFFLYRHSCQHHVFYHHCVIVSVIANSYEHHDSFKKKKSCVIPSLLFQRGLNSSQFYIKIW